MTTYITSTRDGRPARAGVRAALADTKELRWLDSDFADDSVSAERIFMLGCAYPCVKIMINEVWH